MANSTASETINPEVMPMGSVLPLKFTLPAGANGFVWGVLTGMVLLGVVIWVAKKKL